MSAQYGRVGPKLYMGSKPPADHRMGLVFDTVVLCAMADEYQPPAGSFGRANILRCPINDGVLTSSELKRSLEAGSTVASRVRAGRRTLVTCYMGLNRSGLVTGFGLLCLGASAEDAIARIRAARGRNALCNPHFVKLLKQYEGRLRPSAGARAGG